MRARRSWRSAPRRSRIRACRNGSRGSSAVAELVVAFDVPSGREALALARRLPGLRWAKLGPGLYVREGPALVREFLARGVHLFLDLKWHDIPSAVAGAVAAARPRARSTTRRAPSRSRTPCGAGQPTSSWDGPLPGPLTRAGCTNGW